MTTVSTVVTNARGILQDTDSDSYRYTQAELVSYLNEAIQELRRLRPDFFVGSFNTSLPSYAEADIAAGTEVDVEDFLAPALVNYVAGRAQLRDDEFVSDGRAVALINRWTSQIRTTGA